MILKSPDSHELRKESYQLAPRKQALFYFFIRDFPDRLHRGEIQEGHGLLDYLFASGIGGSATFHVLVASTVAIIAPTALQAEFKYGQLIGLQVLQEDGHEYDSSTKLIIKWHLEGTAATFKPFADPTSGYLTAVSVGSVILKAEAWDAASGAYLGSDRVTIPVVAGI